MTEKKSFPCSTPKVNMSICSTCSLLPPHCTAGAADTAWGSGPAQAAPASTHNSRAFGICHVTWSQLPCSLTPRAVDMLGTFSFIYMKAVTCRTGLPAHTSYLCCCRAAALLHQHHWVLNAQDPVLQSCPRAPGTSSAVCIHPEEAFSLGLRHPVYLLAWGLDVLLLLLVLH